MQICWNFLLKKCESFCSTKATHIFSAKNIRILYIESIKTVNEMTLNELVKLTTLWTTGPWSFTLCLAHTCLPKVQLILTNCCVTSQLVLNTHHHKDILLQLNRQVSNYSFEFKCFIQVVVFTYISLCFYVKHFHQSKIIGIFLISPFKHLEPTYSDTKNCLL